MSQKFITPFLALLLILSSSLAMYWPVLGFSYVWDDTLLFLDKTALLNDTLNWKLLSEPVLPGTSYLRPFVFLTFYIEFMLFGQSPLVSHSINLIIFLLNISLLFVAVHRISLTTDSKTGWKAAFIASTLYAMHPALIESVAWVSGRFDLLVTTFILLSVIIFLSKLSNWLRNSILALLMLGGLLSKELAFVLPAILFCVWIACNASQFESAPQTFARGIKENTGLFLLLLLTFLLYLYIRANTVNGVYHAELNADYIRSIWWENLLPLEALKFYFTQVFIPFSNINPQHPVAGLAPWSAKSLIASGSLLIFIALWFVYAWKNRTASAWLALAGLACILPVIHLLPLSISDNLGHERFMTTALAFFCAAIALLPYPKFFAAIKVRRHVAAKLIGLLLSGWLVVAAWTVVTVLPFWSTDLQLWNWAHRAHPDMEAVRYNYFYGALQEGRMELVEEAVTKLLEENGSLNPNDQLLYAHTLFRRGDPESMKYLQGVLYALPEFHTLPDGHEMANAFHMTSKQMGGAYSLYSMGMFVFRGDAESALKYIDIAAWYLSESELIPLMYQRAAIFYALGRFDQAEDIIREQKLLRYYRQDQVQLMVKQMLVKYCELEEASEASCAEIRDRGLLDTSTHKL